MKIKPDEEFQRFIQNGGKFDVSYVWQKCNGMDVLNKRQATRFSKRWSLDQIQWPPGQPLGIKAKILVTFTVFQVILWSPDQAQNENVRC